MRILFIGNHSLQNDAIQKILSSRDGWKIKRVMPPKKGYWGLKNNGRFSLSLIDWNSCYDKCKEIISSIRKLKLSPRIAVIFNVSSKEITPKAEEYGVDSYLSIEWETERFVRTVSKLGKIR